jgi:oxalate---CoA ligase
VPLTHGNLTASMANIGAAYALTPADRTFLVMPLFHVHGLLAGLLAPLATGGSVVIQAPKFSARSFWAQYDAHACTWYTAVPTMHQALLAGTGMPGLHRPPPRFIRSASSALAPATLSALEVRFRAPVLEAYAMSEAAHQMTTNPLPPAAHKAGSVGKPVGVQLAILQHGSIGASGVAAEGVRAPQGTAGEVVIRGTNVMTGYWHNPEATAASLVRLPETGSGVGPRGAGHPLHPPVAAVSPLTPWFRTGDEGYLDADGYLFLTGRIKELISRGGEKIAPPEIDAALLTHPAVAEAVAYGVDDKHYGQVVHAAVVLRTPGGATPADLQAHVRQRLAAHKVPVHIHLATALPRTATGKLQRKAVAEHFAAKL